MGGVAQRHWAPHNKRSKWGEGYECWNFTGFSALCAVDDHLVKVQSDEGRATRVDIAFDYHCHPELSPGEMVDAWSTVWHEENMLKAGVSGEGDSKSWTRYIGGKTAPRRIRVYRKDIESCKEIPMMRVELILKEEYATAMLATALQDEQEAFRMAAAHIYAMTGYQAMPGEGEVPKRVAPTRSKYGERLAQAVFQYGTLLTVADEMKVDLDHLLKIRRSNLSLRGQRRLAADLIEANEDGLENIMATAIEQLREIL